ncbi:MAG: DNA mismatch repair endonuclease MutL [Candidatus Margulisiibacteriota bacterium]
MMKVQLLDESTINQIAAGEVIERPASVVKELVENSLDAGASQVTVEVIEGGKSLIRIADNGEGMSPEDARLALQRHATSKLRSASDLFSIKTMGFRGEALPSIASISRLTLDTRTAASDKGLRLSLEGGKELKEESLGSAVGTIISVSDLFYNVPARKKFLKADSTELSQIIAVLEKMILANPKVRFKLTSTGRIILQSTGNEQLLEAVVSIYGKDIASKLLPLVLDTGPRLKIHGLVSLPTYLKNDRKGQVFFVNNRPVNDGILIKALREGFRNTIPTNQHPYAFIFIDIDPSQVDVNVHPAKLEVRFANSQDIFSAVRSAVNNALLGSVTKASDELPEPVRSETSDSTIPRSKIQNPKLSAPSWTPAMLPKWEELISTSGSKTPDTSTRVPITTGSTHTAPAFQVNDSYIAAIMDGELALIDQHAAQERLLFDIFSERLARQETASQQLLVPIVLELSARESVLLNDQLDNLHAMGFELSASGANSFLIRSVPVEIAQRDPNEVLKEVLTELLEDGTGKVDRDALLKMMACKAAIKAGQRLNSSEIAALIDDLQKHPSARTCPHGRPTVIKLSAKELARMFKRT